MKRVYLFLSMTLLLFTYNCSSESVENTENGRSQDPNFKVFDAKIDNINNSRSTSYCLEANLIAGQNHIAGTVSAHTEGDQIIITYTTNEDWTIGATHLSIGDCDEQWVPTTGSGNPKVGKFEHSSEHDEGVNEVVYTLNVDVLLTDFCFAAHAEVSGPTGGETAWAEGTDFDGNSWAMFVEALLNGCTSYDNETGSDNGGDFPITDYPVFK